VTRFYELVCKKGTATRGSEVEIESRRGLKIQILWFMSRETRDRQWKVGKDLR